jgi:hypothetical protein
VTEAAQEGVRFSQAPQRCPFCHSQVALEHDRWVACRQCLARHHAACWGEGGACGACQHDVALSAEEAQSAPASSTTPAFTPVPRAQDDDVARARRETAALFEKQATRERSWLDAFLGPLTLGIYPAVMVERDLARHHELNMDEEAQSPPEGLDDAMARRFEGDRARGVKSRARLLMPMIAAALGGLAVLIGFIGANSLTYPSGYNYTGAYDDYYFWMNMFFTSGMFGYYTALVGYGGYLHAVREAVRGHELRQMYLRLVAEGSPKEKAERILSRTARAWNIRRAIDTVITLLSLIPFFGLFMLPVIAVRYSGALSQHLGHEDELDVLCPRRARPRKGT